MRRLPDNPIPVYASTDPRVKTVPLPPPERQAKSAKASARPRSRPSPQTTMTASGRRYAEAEARWQRFLRRKGTRSHDSGRDVLDLIKAKARSARLRRASQAYPEGSNPTPQGKYAQEDLARLGREGKAMPSPRGGYWFPIVTENDIANAIAVYRALQPSERDGVRAWIIKRTIELGTNAVERLPKGWAQPANNKPAPREREMVGPVGTGLPGGPEGSGGSTGGGTAI